ncbi:MAG: class I SAM-dependent methyltransferase [Nitrospinae bacterium]|nr:class I SAM-dependent methyltransferase [Nitrospinota bacterium]
MNVLPTAMRCNEFDTHTLEEYERFLSSAEAQFQRDRELCIIREHLGEEEYGVPGHCGVCSREVAFLVNRLCGATDQPDGTWVPNWRERLVCPVCALNARQRIVAATARRIARGVTGRPVSAYLMEQITPIYRNLSQGVPEVEWVGSEYLGDGLAGGTLSDGVRHEDVERLSFPDGRFDLLISNDVFEHVNDHRRALAECFRVMRPEGKLLVTIPFHARRKVNVQRACRVDTGIRHIEEPLYHGNPLSEKGSLVFTDFGWDFAADLASVGFRDVAYRLYWDVTHGYLGVGHGYFYAEK